VNQVRTVNLERLAFDPVAERSVGQPVAITQGLKVLRSPVPSSDGKWVTFSSGLPREDILVMRTDGSGTRQLTDDPHSARMPVWSPDDKRIAFCSNRSGKYEIWIINADGSGLQQLTQVAGAQVVSPVWSPDGARLACNRLGAAPLIIDANKPWNDQRPEALPPLGKGDVSFGAHSWSPDGKKLAGHLRRARGVSSGVVVYSFADHTYQEVIGFGSFPVWLSDSRRLVFYDENKIYLTDIRSRRVREIHSTAPRSIEPGTNLNISRDDRWIYFTAVINEADIWSMSVP
jgi:Tol biopolymer transport system component